jgi:Phage tail assembly chaperone proteins, E, or 41 or 14
MDAKTNDKPVEPLDDEALDFDKATDAPDEMPALDAESNFEHTLTKPIQAHGEEVRVLRWREPTGGDIERAGNPVYLDFSGPNPTMTFNEKRMAGMISVLCQLPPSSVRQLTAKDWNAVAWKLFRFFTPPGA